jgi:hypothetical protein
MVASYAKIFLYKSVAVYAFLIVLPPPPLMLFAQQYTIGSFKELDRWYEVSLGNSKVGYAHSLMRMKDNKVYAESVFNLSIKRAGIPIEVTSIQKTEESIDGEILSFSGELKMAGVPVIIKGRTDGNEIIVLEKQFFREHTRRYQLDPDGLMTWGLLKFLREKNFKTAGNEIKTKIYSADFGMEAPTNAKIKTFGSRNIKISGKQRRVFATEISLSTNNGLVSTLNWLDDDGFAVQTTMKLGGLEIEIKQCSMVQAIKSSDTAEFLLNTLVFLEKEIPKSAKTVQFKIDTLNGTTIHDLHESGNQVVTRLNNNSFLVEVSADNWKKQGTGKRIVPSIEFTTPNTMVDSDDPVIRSLAKKAGAGSKNIFDLSQKLFQFSHHFITKKNFRIGFASATEVARTREGDCTEHAVFLAALGKVMGIPSRVASGLVFMKNFQNKENILGFHMWTEFLLKGKWVPLDSALKKLGAHPDRITLSVSSLDGNSVADVSVRIAEMIGNLRVSIEKIEFK